MKKIIALIVCLLLSMVIVFVIPYFSNEKSAIIFGAHTNEESIVPQRILEENGEEKTYYKVYNAGKLVGVVNDIDNFNALIDEKSKVFENEFPGASLSLSGDIYVVDERSKLSFEDINTDIVDYLLDNDLLGLKAKMIEISDIAGNKTSIFVSNMDLFEEAKAKYLSFFVSQDTIIAKNNGVILESPTQDDTYVDMDYAIEEKIEIADIIAPPEEIYSNSSEVFDFLCYGLNPKKQIYETKEGETLQYVGQQFSTTPNIIMMLNRDVLTSEDQILVPGTQLSVVPDWQLTVQVTRQTKANMITLPESPIYIEDESRQRGEIVIDVQEEPGLDNVLYEDVYVNGKLQVDDKGEMVASRVISREVIKEAIQGQITIGSMTPKDFGTGNWGWPTANPIYTCGYYCYTNHGGIDIQNRTNFWGEVLAVDNGVVESVGYTDIGGYYVRINHNNGYVTYYGHMRTYPYVEVGDIVERGDVIGPIGQTGIASAPHVHFAMYKNNQLIDPCTEMACNMIPHGAYEK